jgi:hypothetical protein
LVTNSEMQWAINIRGTDVPRDVSWLEDDIKLIVKKIITLLTPKFLDCTVYM